MQNHFGKGLKAGLSAESAWPASQVSGYCKEYLRGFVLGYAHQQAQLTGDDNNAAFEAGVLSRNYCLDKDLVAEFFSASARHPSRAFFLVGYEGIAKNVEEPPAPNRLS
ncbi:uncharacterized protein DUF2623 [Rahnella sp. BIGb0236]|uniref:DUF2623 family protein n=1 Tax=Rahnella sp. BIGb0236 TaxID=2485117 RepID=UPI00105C9E52|nr:DUF2623 family protein [Rahnella sp. BIGb0236]TDS96625.1 uncharacterized protein DUF2623 [Rahnella sp. BIGb0236]